MAICRCSLNSSSRAKRRSAARIWRALAERHADLLRADGAIWEGGGFDDAERYTFYCGVKGIAYLELRIRGAAYDLHSGYAPMAPNPAWRLVHALSTLKDDRDNITVDGLLAHVRPPTEAELAYIRRIPFDGAKMKTNWGLDAFVNGMGDEEALTRFITAPTCTICGLRSGFIEEGEKTVLPSAAMVKLDFRLVPDLTPELVLRLLQRASGPAGLYRHRDPPRGRHGGRTLRCERTRWCRRPSPRRARSTATSRSFTPRTAAPGRCKRWCKGSARPQA